MLFNSLETFFCSSTQKSREPASVDLKSSTSQNMSNLHASYQSMHTWAHRPFLIPVPIAPSQTEQNTLSVWSRQVALPLNSCYFSKLKFSLASMRSTSRVMQHVLAACSVQKWNKCYLFLGEDLELNWKSPTSLSQKLLSLTCQPFSASSLEV